MGLQSGRHPRSQGRVDGPLFLLLLGFFPPKPLSLKPASAFDERVSEPLSLASRAGRWEALPCEFGARVSLD